MGLDEQQRFQIKQRKAKTAMGFYCPWGSGKNEWFNQGGAASSEPAEGCTVHPHPRSPNKIMKI